MSNRFFSAPLYTGMALSRHVVEPGPRGPGRLPHIGGAPRKSILPSSTPLWRNSA
jgi:hypothetical protein